MVLIKTYTNKIKIAVAARWVTKKIDNSCSNTSRLMSKSAQSTLLKGAQTESNMQELLILAQREQMNLSA